MRMQFNFEFKFDEIFDSVLFVTGLILVGLAICVGRQFDRLNPLKVFSPSNCLGIKL